MTTFTDVSGHFVTLRKRLAAFANKNVIEEITLDPPRGSRDELSFVRLVSWSYALLFEAGRTPFAVLKQLPPWKENGQLLPHVRALRTWTSHNLALGEAPNVKTLRVAYEWLTSTCGTGSPSEDAQWEKCISVLCKEIHGLLSKALLACDSFDHNEDKEQILEELLSRLDRNWAAHKFDIFVEASKETLGFIELDVVAFRVRHLDQWRKVLSSAGESKDMTRLLRMRIDADLLSHMGDALPLTSDELDRLLERPDRQSLLNALFTLRAVPAEHRQKVVGLLSSSQE